MESEEEGKKMRLTASLVFNSLSFSFFPFFSFFFPLHPTLRQNDSFSVTSIHSFHSFLWPAINRENEEEFTIPVDMGHT